MLAMTPFQFGVKRLEVFASIDSLYRVSVALKVPLSFPTDVERFHRSVPHPDAEKIAVKPRHR